MPERVFSKIMLSENNAPLSMTASAVFGFCFLFLFRFVSFFLFRYCKELFLGSVSEDRTSFESELLKLLIFLT